MKKPQNSVDMVIERLGYSHSAKLFYFHDIKQRKKLSTHINNFIDKISPYAFYLVEEKPFVLFFESSPNDDLKRISKLVWNAQIPIAIICSQSDIKIYNGYSIDASRTLKLLKETRIEDCNENSDFSFWNISNPEFWDNQTKNYSDKRLNTILLENITFLTNELKEKYKIKFATKLILRLIFIRYLIDRGVNLDYKGFDDNIDKSRMQLSEILDNREQLYSLFVHLKNKFNGNLFDLNDEKNDSCLTQAVFNLISEFLEGTKEFANGQRSLFEFYDFSIIPVELISNIYEIMLGKETQDKDKAFYTPHYLVDYILKQKIFPYLSKSKNARVLDPACGSGIFLVSIYRQMIEENLNGNVYSGNDNILIDVLRDNIFGVDWNEEAIDVAIFSLYLTILDYKDPKTLVSLQLPDLKGKNLFKSDFFNEKKLEVLSKINFDFIIGNPPWGKIKSGLHMDYCRKYGYDDMQQNEEICRSFIFRVKDFCNENTQCCLILHSKLLYNQKQPSKKFRKHMLEKSEINRIIEMSAVRDLVFENANGPAIIVFFKYKQSDCSNNQMTYISMKRNVFFKLFNIIMIEKSDVKYIEQSFLIAKDWAWKTLVYGFSGDIDVIFSLKKYPTIKNTIDSKNSNLSASTGIKYADGEQDASHLVGLKLVFSKKAIQHFSLDLSEVDLFQKTKIDRARKNKKSLFNPPHCLISKWEDADFSMKSVYSEKKVVFTDSVYLIKGKSSEEKLLLNLVGLFNSSFFSYLNLMLGSSTGIERNQCFMTEIFNFPYVFDENIAASVKEIQAKKARFPLVDENDFKKEIGKLNQIILDKFNLSKNVFVDYALKIQIPQLTDSFDAYRKVSKSDLVAYSKCFDDHFSLVYSRVKKYIGINIYHSVMNRYAIFELVISEKKPQQKINFPAAHNSDKAFLTQFSVSKYNDLFYNMSDVIAFEKASFFIIKPNFYKNWHPAIAQVDLAEVIDKIFSNEKGDQ